VDLVYKSAFEDTPGNQARFDKVNVFVVEIRQDFVEGRI
jgi:hypothetical protein